MRVSFLALALPLSLWTTGAIGQETKTTCEQSGSQVVCTTRPSGVQWETLRASPAPVLRPPPPQPSRQWYQRDDETGPASATAERFDLLCVGYPYRINAASLATERIGPDETIILQVDLKAMIYCTAPCREPLPIKSTSYDSIDLNETVVDGITERVWLDRIYGTLGRSRTEAIGGDARLISLFTGACSKSAFTPFPERRF